MEEKGNKVCLKNKNTFDHMGMFWRLNAKHSAILDSKRLLYDMVCFGKSYPAMEWIEVCKGKAWIGKYQMRFCAPWLARNLFQGVILVTCSLLMSNTQPACTGGWSGFKIGRRMRTLSKLKFARAK